MCVCAGGKRIRKITVTDVRKKLPSPSSRYFSYLYSPAKVEVGRCKFPIIMLAS